jgi:hypothetical protein
MSRGVSFWSPQWKVFHPCNGLVIPPAKFHRADLEVRIKNLRGDPQLDDDVNPLDTADEEVIRKVLAKAIIIDPANRADAKAIVALMPATWDTMEAGAQDIVDQVSILPTTLPVPNN